MNAPYPMDQWRLALPVNKDGNLYGTAAEINPPHTTEDHVPYYELIDGVLIFRCPDKGATTATAHYPRSEMRHIAEYAITQRSRFDLVFAVVALPLGEKVVVMQAHDAVEPMVKLVYRNGDLYALVKRHDAQDDLNVPVMTGLRLGDKVVASMEFIPAVAPHGQHLIITANGHRVDVAMHRKGLHGAMYWKAGAYYQTDAGLGHWCEVHHFSGAVS